MLNKLLVLMAIGSLMVVAPVGTSIAREKAGVKTDCQAIKSVPFYAEYGLQTPKEWRCTGLAKDKKSPYVFFRWETSGKEVVLADDDITKDFYNGEEKNFPDPTAQEPLRTIRANIEAALDDEKVTGKNEYMKRQAAWAKKFPQGFFFSKNNERMISYMDFGEAVRDGVKTTYQVAQVYQKEKGGKFVSVLCYGCTPDDFFSLVINPVIQK